MLKPQDIVILLKIFSTLSRSEEGPGKIIQNQLATHLCMSASEVHAGIKRLILSGLLGEFLKDNSKEVLFSPIKSACEECLISGVRYFFPVQLGTYTRGIATSYAAPIFKQHILLGDDPIPVWPHAKGEQRGLALTPLYRSVPESIISYPDRLFYELLVLVDAIRSGRVRERNIAIKLLREQINDK
ncbi:MAG: hypothetical protein P1U36_09520 [Legionellaceae bacterium]|nr:hypothetical protein [Legionellaceae bacterium]